MNFEKDKISRGKFVNITLAWMMLCIGLSGCSGQSGQSLPEIVVVEKTSTDTPSPTLTPTMTVTLTSSITPSPTITLSPTATEIPPLVLTRDFPLYKENWRELIPKITEEDITSGRWSKASEELNQKYPVNRKFDINHLWRDSDDGINGFGWGNIDVPNFYAEIHNRTQRDRMPAFGDSISWISNFRGSGKDYLVAGMRYIGVDGIQMSIPLIIHFIGSESNMDLDEGQENIYDRMGFSKDGDKLLKHITVGTCLYFPVTAVNRDGAFYSWLGDDVINSYYDDTKQERKDLVKKFLKKSIFIEGMDRILWAASPLCYS